jgi:hypothetical protein
LVVTASRFFALAVNALMAALVLCSLLPQDFFNIFSLLMVYATIAAYVLYFVCKAFMLAVLRSSIWAASGNLARFCTMALVPAASIVVCLVDPSQLLVLILVVVCSLLFNLYDWQYDRKARRAPDHPM